MSGTVNKRCTRCGNRVKERTCSKCGLTGSYNWAFRAYVGKDADGRRIRQLRGGFPTRKDTERALRELLNSVEDGGFIATSTMTLAESLRDEWLPATAPPRVKYQDVERPPAPCPNMRTLRQPVPQLLPALPMVTIFTCLQPEILRQRPTRR